MDGLPLVERLALRERPAPQRSQQQVSARRIVDPRTHVRATRLNRRGEAIRPLGHHRHPIRGPKALRVRGHHLAAQPALLERRALLRQHDHPTRDLETFPVVPEQLQLLALSVEAERATGIGVDRDLDALHALSLAAVARFSPARPEALRFARIHT